MAASADPLTAVLADFRKNETTDFGHAWAGNEPTFQSKKSIKKWAKFAAKGEVGEDAYFHDDYMLKTQKRVAKRIEKSFKKLKAEGQAACIFDRVTRKGDLDQWNVQRQNLKFHWPGDEFEPFEVRFGLDPETFEYSIKPVPVAWYYDDRFVDFLEAFVWQPPLAEGLTASIAHGGGQFSFSVKTFLTGSLLADVIATLVNHPELCTWIMDWPNPDDRAFRATRSRLDAFRKILDHYWAGAFHPKAIGTLTPANPYHDFGFGPAANAPAGLMNPNGPLGSDRDIFQTNFAFGQAVRWQAQNVEPGYWQSAHPKEDGYRPDQIMRYSEGNLNRLQIAGELHVKSMKVLNPERIPEYNAPLDRSMLYDECSWENRGQMGRTSARDYVEALLLDVHHAQHLLKSPGVKIKASVLQDLLLGDGEATLRKHAPQVLDELKRDAREQNLEASEGRVKSDWIEPETLFWAAWRALPAKEKAEVAYEAVASFAERVEQAAACDPRPQAKTDAMEWHRHRIHPELWQALENRKGWKQGDGVRRELEAWQGAREKYLGRRPVFSQAGLTPPWEGKDS